MTITNEEAVNFSKFAYSTDNPNFALSTSYQNAGWQTLLLTGPDEYEHGYDGAAFVKVVNGVATELVIAHRGTEFSGHTELDDVWQDLKTGSGFWAESHQPDEMRDFIARAKAAYNDFLDADPLVQGPAADDILTHTGHSLGGWLATIAANDAGAAGRAITFDAPQTTLTTTEADIKTILATPNMFNQAGSGSHVGQIYVIPDTDQSALYSEGFVALLNQMIKETDVPEYKLALVTFLSEYDVHDIDKYAPALSYFSYSYGQHDIDRLVANINAAVLTNDPSLYENSLTEGLANFYMGNPDANQLGVIGQQILIDTELAQWLVEQNFLPEFDQRFRDAIDNADFDAFNAQPVAYFGTPGAETYTASGDNDVAAMLGGNDTIMAGDNEVVVDGGAGSDWLDYSTASQGIDIDLHTGVAFFHDAAPIKDVYVNIENVIGSDFHDEIVGNTSNNTLEGGNSDDLLEGSTGNDLLKGDAGVDSYIFVSGDGEDIINDSDGVGKIVIDGVEIKGQATYDNLTQWWLLDDHPQYYLEQSGADMILHKNGETANSVTIKDFQPGETRLGIAADNSLVTFEFSTTVNASAVGGSAAAPFVLRYTFDPNLISAGHYFGINDPEHEAEYHPVSGTLTLEGQEVTFTSGSILIANDASSQVIDNYYILINEPGSFDGTLYGYELWENGGPAIGFQFYDYSAAMLNSIDLPVNAAFAAAAEAFWAVVTLNVEDYEGFSLGQSIGATATLVAIGQSLTGTSAEDTMSGSVADDTMDGGANTDTVSYARATQTVTINLAAGTASGAETGSDTLISIESARGGSGADSITGSDAANSLAGGDGNDTLAGGAGNDTLVGGAGTDAYVFSGAFGQDVVTDSDGLGSIVIDGVTLSGAAVLDEATGHWNLENHAGYYLEQSGSDMLLKKTGDAGNFITITDFAPQTSKLGIDLSLPPPPPEGFITFRFETTIDATEVGGGADASLVMTYTFDPALAGVANGPFSKQYSPVSGTLSVDGQSVNFTNGSISVFNDAGTSDKDDSYDVRFSGGTLFGYEVNLMRFLLVDDQFTMFSDTSLPTDTSFTLAADFQQTDIILDDYNYFLGISESPSTPPEQKTPFTLSVYTPGQTIMGTAGADSLTGGAGNDSIDGAGGNDTLDGGAGNDTLVGGSSGADSLLGGNGDDLLQGGSNLDTLRGGAGADSLDGGDANDVLYGEDGNDTLDGGIAGADSLDGGLGADLLLGGSNIDTLHGGDGNDSLDGGDADDLLYGDAGNDTLNGGIAGADSLEGGIGEDLLLGGGNHDTLRGGDDNDTLYGSSGNDSLFGDAGDDVLYGENDNDTLYGGDGQDDLRGEDGNDLIYGDAGNDMLHGYAGLDTLYGGTGDDFSNGAEGNDVLYGDADNDSLLGGDDNDTLYGGIGNDSLKGEAGDDVLFGEDGADTLRGGDGNDSLEGGLGDDTLDGGLGADSFTGGDGIDTLTYIYSAGAVNVDMAAGTGTGSEAQDDVIGTGIEILIGTNYADTLAGSAGVDTIYGGLLGDSISGNAGNDKLWGEDGDDSLYGGAGNDDLRGQSGNDVIYGEADNDTLHGYAGDDSLYGGVGNDLFNGAEGNDAIYGQDGNDTLLGGTGNDTLTGGIGNDKLRGEAGADSMIGGDGVDTFEFMTLTDSTSTSRDTIADFAHGTDKISVANIASINGMGDLTITLDSGNTVITSGGGFEFLLTGDFTQGASQLTASDFIF